MAVRVVETAGTDMVDKAKSVRGYDAELHPLMLLQGERSLVDSLCIRLAPVSDMSDSSSSLSMGLTLSVIPRQPFDTTCSKFGNGCIGKCPSWPTRVLRIAILEACALFIAYAAY